MAEIHFPTERERELSELRETQRLDLRALRRFADNLRITSEKQIDDPLDREIAETEIRLAAKRLRSSQIAEYIGTSAQSETDKLLGKYLDGVRARSDVATDARIEAVLQDLAGEGRSAPQIPSEILGDLGAYTTLITVAEQLASPG